MVYDLVAWKAERRKDSKVRVFDFEKGEEQNGVVARYYGMARCACQARASL